MDTTPRKIIKDKEVTRRTGRSRVQRWRDIKAGKFPAPVELGPNQIGWFEDEIDKHLASFPRCHYAPGPEANAA